MLTQIETARDTAQVSNSAGDGACLQRAEKRTMMPAQAVGPKEGTRKKGQCGLGYVEFVEEGGLVSISQYLDSTLWASARGRASKHWQGQVDLGAAQ